MLVSQILKHKGDLVFTTAPDETLEQAGRKLMERGVGAMVVLDGDEHIVGILSERDIVQAIARRGAEALASPVAQSMTRDVIYARPKETVDDLLGRMTDRRVRHLPVCGDDDSLCGIISIGDLVKWKISEVEEEASELKAYIAQG